MDDDLDDLAARRPRVGPGPVPPAVRTEIELARRLGEALAEQGYAMRFVVPDGGGRVRAEIRSADGKEVRPLSLFEAIGAEPADLS